MSRFVISPGAQADLNEIWDYVAVTNENATAARKLMKTFRNAFAVLGNHPNIGELRNDLSVGIRLFPVGSYVVVFLPSDDDVVSIVQVIHGARDLNTAFRDLES